jgi:hypothetical protein
MNRISTHCPCCAVGASTRRPIARDRHAPLRALPREIIECAYREIDATPQELVALERAWLAAAS